MSFAAVQKHVAVLERAGLVTKERHGREQLVRTDAGAVARARQALDDLEATWRSARGPDVGPARPGHGGRRVGTHLDWRNGLGITSLDTDYDNLTITLIADFDASIERVWDLWSDPRKLERWSGPPTHPATFATHDLTPGGQATYVMTGPDGAMRGTWRVTSVDPPTSLEFRDAFADTDGRRIADMPVFTVRVQLTERARGTRMEMQLTFKSSEDMDKLMSTGIVDGLRQAVGQIDGLLA